MATSLEYARAQRADPRHADIDWVLSKWNRASVHTNAKSGYLQTTIWSRTYQIHQLVWMEANHSFVPTGFELNHIDGIKSHCTIDNLELVTHKRNMDHARNVLGKICNRPRKYTDAERKAKSMAQIKKWMVENPERLKESQRAYYKANKERLLPQYRINQRKAYERRMAALGKTVAPYNPKIKGENQ